MKNWYVLCILIISILLVIVIDVLFKNNVGSIMEKQNGNEGLSYEVTLRLNESEIKQFVVEKNDGGVPVFVVPATGSNVREFKILKLEKK
ncbi:MAG TPA: hypothetical protein VK145_00235 [Candidatus Nanoarchaeia archaeon]|nr:hypothetical protein [Candidatus Nanoarchaeia archaeon]